MIRVKAWALVAQAVINIDSGITTIEKDSAIYHALVFLLRKEIRDTSLAGIPVSKALANG